MKPAITIRAIRASDLAEYQRLRLYGLKESPPAFGTSYSEAKKSSRKDLLKFICPGRGQGVTVGVFAKELIGLGGLFRCTRLKEQHKAFIWGLYVHPDFRGRGLARKIMKALMAAAEANRDLLIVNLTVTSSNTAAKRLYEKLGFKNTGYEPKALRIDGVFYDWEHMSYVITRRSARAKKSGG